MGWPDDTFNDLGTYDDRSTPGEDPNMSAYTLPAYAMPPQQPAPDPMGEMRPPPMPEPFTKSDDLQLQRLQQALSQVEQQAQSGVIRDDEAAQLKAQIMGRMQPLQQRKAQADQQAEQQEMQGAAKQQATQGALQALSEHYAAQTLQGRVGVYVDPVSGRDVHFAPPGWTIIPFEQKGAAGDVGAVGSKGDDSPEPLIQKLPDDNEPQSEVIDDSGEEQLGPHARPLTQAEQDARDEAAYEVDRRKRLGLPEPGTEPQEEEEFGKWLQGEPVAKGDSSFLDPFTGLPPVSRPQPEPQQPPPPSPAIQRAGEAYQAFIHAPRPHRMTIWNGANREVADFDARGKSIQRQEQQADIAKHAPSPAVLRELMQRAERAFPLPQGQGMDQRTYQHLMVQRKQAVIDLYRHMVDQESRGRQHEADRTAQSQEKQRSEQAVAQRQKEMLGIKSEEAKRREAWKERATKAGMIDSETGEPVSQPKFFAAVQKRETMLKNDLGGWSEKTDDERHDEAVRLTQRDFRSLAKVFNIAQPAGAAPVKPSLQPGATQRQQDTRGGMAPQLQMPNPFGEPPAQPAAPVQAPQVP